MIKKLKKLKVKREQFELEKVMTGEDDYKIVTDIIRDNLVLIIVLQAKRLFSDNIYSADFVRREYFNPEVIINDLRSKNLSCKNSCLAFYLCPDGKLKKMFIYKNKIMDVEYLEKGC